MATTHKQSEVSRNLCPLSNEERFTYKLNRWVILLKGADLLELFPFNLPGWTKISIKFHRKVTKDRKQSGTDKLLGAKWIQTFHNI